MHLYVCAAVVGVRVHDGPLQQSLVESGTKDVRAHLLEKSGKEKNNDYKCRLCRGRNSRILQESQAIPGARILNYRWAVRFQTIEGKKIMPCIFIQQYVSDSNLKGIWN